MKHVTVTEAHEQMQHGATYLDVRSTREFAMGHPAGAFNVPLLEPDEETGVMQPNADFVRVIQAVFPAETGLVIGCQAGTVSVSRRRAGADNTPSSSRASREVVPRSSSLPPQRLRGFDARGAPGWQPRRERGGRVNRPDPCVRFSPPMICPKAHARRSPR